VRKIQNYLAVVMCRQLRHYLTWTLLEMSIRLVKWRPAQPVPYFGVGHAALRPQYMNKICRHFTQS